MLRRTGPGTVPGSGEGAAGTCEGGGSVELLSAKVLQITGRRIVPGSGAGAEGTCEGGEGESVEGGECESVDTAGDRSCARTWSC